MKLNKFINDNPNLVRCFLTIDEINKIPVDVDIEQMSFKDNSGDDYNCYVFEHNGSYVRVPKTVMSQLSFLLDKNPGARYFSVNRVGYGYDTRYTVKIVE